MIYQIICFIILFTFYGCYFIKTIIQTKSGIQTNQLGKGKQGSIRFIEITMKISTFIIPPIEIICIYFNIFLLPNWARILGTSLGVLGVLIFICAVITMKDNWRAGIISKKDDNTKLVTNGIYQISRNPAFLGFDLVYIGILMTFFNCILLIVSLFGILMFHIQIVNVEEDFLISTFGNEYLNYMKKVNRYIGQTRYKKV